jgi:hypothetical protein
MTDEAVFPRRKRVEHSRTGKGLPAEPIRKSEGPSAGLVSREALDIARYITDMTAQLEAMAVAARLDLLAYFLGMARAESELFVRTNTVAEGEPEDEDPFDAPPSYRQPQESGSFD